MCKITKPMPGFHEHEERPYWHKTNRIHTYQPMCKVRRVLQKAWIKFNGDDYSKNTMGCAFK